MTQAGFAQLVNVSQKTVERWESEKKPVTGPIVTLIKIFSEYPQLCNEYKVPEKTEPMRLWYMYKNEVCTIIDVNERKREYRYTTIHTTTFSEHLVQMKNQPLKIIRIFWNPDVFQEPETK